MNNQSNNAVNGLQKSVSSRLNSTKTVKGKRTRIAKVAKYEKIEYVRYSPNKRYSNFDANSNEVKKLMKMMPNLTLHEASMRVLQYKNLGIDLTLSAEKWNEEYNRKLVESKHNKIWMAIQEEAHKTFEEKDLSKN